MRLQRVCVTAGALGFVCLTGGPAAAIPRAEIVAAAPAFEEHAWYCGPEQLVADCADSSWQPAVTEVGPQIGLPYCWGGWVTIDQFDEQIALGYGAGSLPRGLFLDCTTGLDCSGYVSQLWQHPHKLGTATIPDVSTEIDVTAMQPGDVFNAAGSHVIMFLGEDTSGDAIVTESTTGSCMGVCRRSRPWSAFDGYVPRAYDYADLPSSTQAGTRDDLIWIESFPYQDERTTEGAPSDEFDYYSAAPDTDESGPELIYVFYVVSGGTLTASVMDAPGVDIDIHLLSSLDASACLARDDQSITVPITDPGTYYLVADTYVGSSGTEYTGWYALSADFDGQLGPPPDDPPPDDPPPDDPPPDDPPPQATGDEADTDGCECGLAGQRPARSMGAGVLLMAAALWLARRRTGWTSRKRNAP